VFIGAHRWLKIKMRGLNLKHALLALILISSFALKLDHLGHQSLKPLDESFHAIVAANFLKHPLTPTLNEQQFVPRDYRNWQNAQIWLHKPPMALWQIAISYTFLGINAFALRFPSALLSTAAIWLTYLIGVELLDDIAALIAAALQAFNPVILLLIHGYLFSDAVDISLLFWIEVAIYFLLRAMRSRRRNDFIFCGIAQGLALLSKTYPALIVTGLAFVAWILPQLKMRGRDLWIVILATLATILPWCLWAAIRWPHEFFYENFYILRHVSENIEDWGAPWDRMMFDYLIRAFRTFYPIILAAIFFLTIRAWRDRNEKLWFILAWALGVIVPHLLATSKTPSGTLVGWPALWLLLGYLISLAIRGDLFALGIWLIAMLLALLVRVNDIPTEGRGYPPSPGMVMWQHFWVIWQMLAALGGGAVFLLFKKFTTHLKPLVYLAATVTIVICFIFGANRADGYVRSAWLVTQMDKETPNFRAIGKFAGALPTNASFIVDEHVNVENKLVQFAADRTCYWVKNLKWEPIGQQIIQGGGLPYLITDKPMDLPVVFVDKEDKRMVYACSPRAKAAADQSAGVLMP
jgi:4-amino-4-deoxy-L-arabinose transferase-like glycosyltransferase